MNNRTYLFILAVLILLIAGCGPSPEEVEATAAALTAAAVTDTPTPTNTPPPPTATSTPVPPTATPTITPDPELEAFATELADINMRLKEGLYNALLASEAEWKDAMVVLAEINRDAQKLEVPKDNEVAQELLPLLLACTEDFHEDMRVEQLLRVVPDCQVYIELINKLSEE